MELNRETNIPYGLLHLPPARPLYYLLEILNGLFGFYRYPH